MSQRSRRFIVRLVPMLLAFGLSALILEAGSGVYLRASRGYDGEHLMNYRFDPYKIILLWGLTKIKGLQHVRPFQ